MTDIPYNDLASGIEHGPYPAAPQELIDHYVALRQNSEPRLRVPLAQFIDDVQSEWQYDQHSVAVEDAMNAGRITAEHARYMLDGVLRPWFIGTRN